MGVHISVALLRADKQALAPGSGVGLSVHAFVDDDASRELPRPARSRSLDRLPDHLSRRILGRLDGAVKDVLADVFGVAPELFEALDLNVCHGCLLDRGVQTHSATQNRRPRCLLCCSPLFDAVHVI